MAEARRIARRTRICARTGEPIGPGQTFYSALVERGEDFERQDFGAEVWPEVEKEGFFSYWRNKPSGETEDKKPKVDYDRLLAFFDRLEGSEEPGRRLFRYVLALILTRRRILRLDDTAKTPEGDRLILHDRREGGRRIEVLAPEATREQLEATQEKLNRLFEYDGMDDPAAAVE